MNPGCHDSLVPPGPTLSYGKYFLSYVNKLALAEIYFSSDSTVYGETDTPCTNAISKMHVVGEGPGASLSLEVFLFMISSLLIVNALLN